MAEHWVEDLEFPLEDWKYEVENDDTRLGYCDWVAARKEQNEEDQRDALIRQMLPEDADWLIATKERD